MFTYLLVLRSRTRCARNLCPMHLPVRPWPTIHRYGRSCNAVDGGDHVFQLQKPMVESPSSRLGTSHDPLQMLIDAARCCNSPLVEENARIFMDHASKLIDVGSRRRATHPDYGSSLSLSLSGCSHDLLDVRSSRRRQTSSSGCDAH